MSVLNGFALQNNTDREELVVIKHCLTNNIPYRVYKDTRQVPIDWIPVGSVEWVLEVIGYNIVPDYYPDFLIDLLHRKVWCTKKWPIEEGVFVKPADRYKRFTGFVTKGGYIGKKRGRLICSDCVSFKNEWRCYVSNGTILTSEWYDGCDEGLEFPGVDVQWPDGFCGAVDFGSTVDNQMLLIESQHPFSIGWYGDGSKDRLYIEFLVRGWEYIIRFTN